MLTYDLLDTDQLSLIDRLYEHDETLVYATMGSGKTVCYLTAVSELLADKVIKRVLIVAPLNPCKHVWAHEHKKWAHLAHLDVSICTGTPANRIAAIESSADIVVINIENLAWFLDSYKKRIDFDALCIDETSKFGDTGNKTVKKLRHATKLFKHSVGLTGTPVHEGFIKLFSQVLVLDGGKRLGTNKQKFLETYFYTTDYNGYNWELRAGMESNILDKLKSLIYAMPDYTHTLPPLNEHVIPVNLTDSVIHEYNCLAKHSVIYTPIGEIIADSAAVLSGKLEQFANGFLYFEGIESINFHYAKIDAFKQFICDHEKPLLVFYQFQEDKRRLCAAMDKLNINYQTTDSKNGVPDFLANKVQVLLLHPKSAGHGLNLQVGGCRDILCYCPIWSNDQFKQLVGRLWRRGINEPVNVSTLCSIDTVDEVKIARVESKGDYDKLFNAHIKGT